MHRDKYVCTRVYRNNEFTDSWGGGRETRRMMRADAVARLRNRRFGRKKDGNEGVKEGEEGREGREIGVYACTMYTVEGVGMRE